MSFFPQLVAGPIERRGSLLTQVKECSKKRLWTWDGISSGFGLMLWGFFMKMCIADRISIFVDAVFNNVYACGTVETVLGAGAFAIQIYADFAGYSAIAIGAARMMGFTLMENFNAPYFAESIGEFWRRWHISLSTWFRDYVYIPLGGNRKGTFRKYVNLMITFLLSGLWHGAAWHFAAWGVIHGLFIVFERLTEKLRDGMWKRVNVDPKGGLVRTVRRVMTFVSVCFAWIFFRAGSIAGAFSCIKVIFTDWHAFSLGNIGFTLPGLISAAAGIIVLAAIERGRFDPEAERRLSGGRASRIRNSAYVAVLWTVAAAWLLLLAGSGESAFIYFQF